MAQMLSRVADALYWMSRYVERAEHAARVLEVTRGALIDLAEVDPDAAEAQKSSILSALALPDLPAEQLVFDESESASIASCIARGRENSRAVREIISSEMWENLNEAYWMIREAAEAPDREESLSDTLAAVKTASLLWSGVTDGTMIRGEGWLFVKLGQFVERADRTSRLVAARTREMGRMTRDSSRTNLEWLNLLRSCSALEAFRKEHPARVDPREVIAFLVLDPAFPRTVRYSVNVAADFAKRISQTTGDRGTDVERAFGRLSARVDYADRDELFETGVDEFLEGVLEDLARASITLQRTYFLH